MEAKACLQRCSQGQMPGSLLRSVILPLAYSRVFRFPLKCIIRLRLWGWGGGRRTLCRWLGRQRRTQCPLPEDGVPLAEPRAAVSADLTRGGCWWLGGGRRGCGKGREEGELERLSLGFPEITAGGPLGPHLPNSGQSGIKPQPAF